METNVTGSGTATGGTKDAVIPSTNIHTDPGHTHSQQGGGTDDDSGLVTVVTALALIISTVILLVLQKQIVKVCLEQTKTYHHTLH